MFLLLPASHCDHLLFGVCLLCLLICVAQSSEDSRKYVETLIGVYQKYSQKLDVAFEGDTALKEAMDKALKHAVNRNGVTSNGKRSARSPELLAKYCDTLLKKGSKVEDDQLERHLANVMIIFQVRARAFDCWFEKGISQGWIFLLQ